MNYESFTYGFLAGFVAALCLYIYGSIKHAPVIEDGPSEYPHVDPWRLQLILMRASAQKVPVSPHLNETSLLYLALVLEEVTETMEALRKPLTTWVNDRVKIYTGSYNQEFIAQVDLTRLLKGEAIGRLSRAIRAALMQTGSFDVPLSIAAAQELLDGTTDIAVVNSGLCIASGLPGSAAYLAVQTSNLSKRNPRGIIDKEPDGKWIKGPNYVPPDLNAVLIQDHVRKLAEGVVAAARSTA